MSLRIPLRAGSFRARCLAVSHCRLAWRRSQSKTWSGLERNCGPKRRKRGSKAPWACQTQTGGRAVEKSTRAAKTTESSNKCCSKGLRAPGPVATKCRTKRAAAACALADRGARWSRRANATGRRFRPLARCALRLYPRCACESAWRWATCRLRGSRHPRSARPRVRPKCDAATPWPRWFPETGQSDPEPRGPLRGPRRASWPPR